ncbi:hypothetical protein ACINJI_002721 [Cronobacter dublinensis]|uniref:hypothetical protein n=1 Tax=Cronobacter dublinensis TaxID=413497 RepID=UPI0023DB9954|nr:hypothetical protein [Cronobacter dublinensis]WEP50506.1 hypothetical protein NMY27_04715 [Cronobacter dublinensis]
MRRTQKDGLFDYPLNLKFKPLHLGKTEGIAVGYEGGAEIAFNSETARYLPGGKRARYISVFSFSGASIGELAVHDAESAPKSMPGF